MSALQKSRSDAENSGERKTEPDSDQKKDPFSKLLGNLQNNPSHNIISLLEFGPEYFGCESTNFVDNIETISPDSDPPQAFPVFGTNKLLLLYGLKSQPSPERLQSYTALLSQQERHLQELSKVRSLRSYSKTLFENCPDGIVLADSRGYIIQTNRAMVLMARKPFTALIGLKASQLTNKEGRLKAFEALRKLDKQPKSSLDCQLKVGAGRTIPVSICFSDVTIQGEKLILGTVRDMSYLVEEGKRFSNYEASLARVIRNATDAFVFYDDFGRITEANPATEKLTGVFSTRLLGRPVDDLLSDKSLRNFRQAVSRLNENGYASFNCSIKSVDGSEIPSRGILMQFEVEGTLRCRLILQDLRE